MLSKVPRKYSKPRKTYKQAIEPYRLKGLESFLDGLERVHDACKAEGVKLDIGKCLETMRHK